MKKLSIDQKALLLGLLFALPFLALYIAPMALTLGYSLVESSFSRKFVGLTNYIEVWTNDYFQLGLANTTLLTLACVGCTAAVMLFVCFFCQFLSAGGRRLTLLLCVPFFAPSSSMAAIWRAIFGTTLFSPEALLRASLLCLFLWKYLGVCILVLSESMRQVPAECLEAAALDGAGPARCYVSIVLPMCRGMLTLLLVLTAAYALRLYREAYLLYGEYPSDGTYLLQHFLTNHFRKLHYPVLAAGSVIYAGMGGLLYGAVWLIGRRKGHDVP